MLTVIVTSLFLALTINILLKKINLPTIIGYIFTGTIIAYGFNLHDAVNNHTLKEIAEFGVVFLMFTIGLEFSLAHLKKMKNEVFVAGTLQILITAVIVFSISYFLLDIEKNVSFVLSLAIALSSTAIVLKTFNETGEINRRYGQRSLGILIMQDIAVIPILLTIGFMSSASNSSVTDVLGEMVLHAAMLLALMVIIGKYLLEPFFKAITKTNSDELFVGTILFLAIGASLLAHELGFSYSLGAFIAGMLIAETRYKHQAEADLVPFRDLLLGIFFVTVGMQLKFDIISSYIHIILALLFSVMILKFVIIYAIIRINENKRVSMKTALSLVQVGEFSLALLELARTGGLVPAPYGQIMIVTIVLSMIITPIILKNLTFITDKFNKEEEPSVSQDLTSSILTNHTVILGLGEFGRNIADDLSASSEKYIAIENNIESFYKSINSGYNVVFGNATNKDLLRTVNLKEAKYVIVAIDNPKKLYQVCDTIQQIVPIEKIIVKIHTKKESDIIDEFNIANVFIENRITSKKITELIINEE
ncbi:sodium:proton exchanger [Malaciobacter canalis]|uniref:Sodium:proton exchanger n=1 Tax=Malaciobacter canalis TaxID=1912871 RepID=A0ABX4LN58_9BACT|nr:cation:proton antiporter [Malaciobacter canalis]PHO09311.1 sodium:proton exchanger [Malaciobacter canalis]QEE32123.1 glutathione-regulated potassium-efflux system protein, KefB/KefC family [Malaciobacter canalis]